MATGKQGFVRAAEPQHSVSMQREKEMRVQAPLTTMYIQAVPGLPSYPQAQPAAMQDTAVIPLSVPMMCANQTLPVLTLHIASGAAIQQQRPETPASSPRPKSAGKHVCPHCGRDCLKPSVLEKHLRCHTGERPYPCTTCGISFKTQSNLYKHKRTQAHARLSSESGKGGFSSQESLDSSRETCSSPSLELQSEDSGDINKNDNALPPATTTTFSPAKDTSADGKVESDTKWALRKAAMVGLIVSPAHGQQELINSAGPMAQLACEGQNEAASLQTKSPRTPLQRQEALSDKLSQGKSQSHDSTDSGFSESSEQHLTSSPGDIRHDPSMESLPESTMELQEPGRSMESDVATDDTKSKVSVQEKQKLEEHILKLISENSVLVDDKHLVNVRPRKTMLSKQGSIDLPMPYTYKDSFHFEMRSSKHQVSNSSIQDRRGRAMYSSVPTQHSTSLEHAPLTRSSSLPFSVGIQNSERTGSPYQVESVPLSRRCSAGNIYQFKSVDHHAPGHRSLVRQAAVDCLSVAEGSSVERGTHSSLSSEGDCIDTSVESGVKRCRRKKAQKFAYNKWYMYGGGTFKKLYNTEKDNLLKSRKTTLSLEQTESQGIQISQQRDSDLPVSVTFTSCTTVSLPSTVTLLSTPTSSQTLSSCVLLQSSLTKQTTGLLHCSLAKQPEVSNSDLNTETCCKGMEEKGKGPEAELTSPIPSERKKQKTEDDLPVLIENTDTLLKQQHTSTSRSGKVNVNLLDAMNQSLQSVCGDAFQTSSISSMEKVKRLNLHRQGSFNNLSCSNQTQLLFKRHSSPLFVGSVSGTAGSLSASSSISSVSQAKTSFLPKYQLKIPCSTDGVSDPCTGNHPSLNQPSPSQTLRLSHQSAQQCHLETSTSSARHSQSTAAMLSTKDPQGTLCTSVTTKTASTASVACIGHNANQTQTQHQSSTSTTIISATPTLALSIPENKQANMHTQNQCTAYTTQSMSGATISSIMSQPLQTFTALGQNHAVTFSTTHSTDSSLSHSSTSTKPMQMYESTPPSAIQNNTCTSAVISRQPSGLPVDTQVPACQNPMDGNPLEISHNAFQGAQFEGKMLLVNDSQPLAQDTFYVQTADLQIVMQLISDEQLALIEPQIEKQDCLSQSFLKDPETSPANKILTGVSSEVHNQCPGETATKLCMVQGNVNKIMLSKTPNRTQTSVGATDPNEEKNTKKACDLNPLYVYSKGLDSSSKAEYHVSSPLDTSTNILQCKPLSSAHDKSNVLKDLKSAGCAIDVRSHLKQKHSESPSELPLADKLSTATESGHQPSNSSVHDFVSTNLSASSGVDQSCQDDTSNPGEADALLTSLNKSETSTARKAVLLKDTVLPDHTSNTTGSDHQHVLMKKGQHNSLHVTSATSKSAEGETIETKAGTSCVSEALLHPQACISTTASSREELFPTVQPCQPESCWIAWPSLATARQMIHGSVLAHTVCQYNPLNQNCNSKLKYEEEGNETHSQTQASVQYLSQQQCSTEGAEVIWSDSEKVKALTASTAQMTSAHFETDMPVFKSTQEERIVCGDTPGGTETVSQKSFTGPWVGGAPHSSQLQREAGTGSQGRVSQEPETGGGGEEKVVMFAAAMDNKCMEQDDHAKEDKREGPTGAPEDFQTAVKPHPHLSQPVINACHNTSSPAQHDTSSITDSARLALCGASKLSHDFPPLGQRECTDLDSSKQVSQKDGNCNPKDAPERIGQSKETEDAPVGCHVRLTTLSTGSSHVRHLHPTCGHLLAHPLLVNAIQKEVQKETQMKKTTQQSQSNDKRLNDGCNTEPYRTINAIPTHPSPLCPNQTNSYGIYPNLICSSNTHNNLTEPNAQQCHLGSSYVEEEDNSSSSDDEGKLVIELE